MKHLFSLAICCGLMSSTVNSAENTEEWVSLFDGKTLTGWTQAGDKAPGSGWQVVDGMIHLSGPGGNLLSAKEYENFEFEWQWKIEKNGNNGIKYWVSAINGKEWLGIEYQMIDDAENHDAKSKPSHASASFYDLKAAAADKPLKPAGEWNTSKVISKNGTLQHFLNGKLVVEADTASPEWKQLLAASKFKNKTGFAPGKGRIMLTDHGDKVWLKELKIRELK
jgi:Domain of Unknown Function (DUF1080)